jgi:hypothetical protein
MEWIPGRVPTMVKSLTASKLGGRIKGGSRRIKELRKSRGRIEGQRRRSREKILRENRSEGRAYGGLSEGG